MMSAAIYTEFRTHPPGLTQEARLGPATAMAGFGTRFIVVPNPMYGSWERNPPR